MHAKFALGGRNPSTVNGLRTAAKRRNKRSEDKPGALIGRDGVAVPDPFQPYRSLLGSVHAERIDADAVLMGDELARLSDDELATRGVPLGSAFAWLDPEGAATTLSWDALLAHAAAELTRVEEDAILLDARVRQRPGSMELEARLAKQEALVEGYEHGLVWLSEHRNKDDGRYLHAALTVPRRRAAAEAVAVAREQAIRSALRDRSLTSGAESAGAAGNVRQIGAADAERRADVEPLRPGEVEEVRLVTRDDVSAPRAIDELRPLIGEARARQIEELMQPLARWVQHEDDAFVRQRRAELGVPALKLDRGAARRARVAECRHESQERERAEAWAEAKRFWDSDPERAHVAATWVNRESPRPRSRSYLDAWMDDNLDRVVRALVYRDEFETRRHVQVQQEVERSIVKPPERLRERIGVRPEADAPEREEWDALARELEGQRLFRESAEREGIKHREPRAKERRALDQRVERFRASAGLEESGELVEAGREPDGAAIEA